MHAVRTDAALAFVDVRRFVDVADARASRVVIAVPLKVSPKRLERALDEPIRKAFERLSAGIAKEAKSAKSRSKSSERSTALAALYARDGSRVADDEPHATAWMDGGALVVGDERFIVRVDAPEIASCVSVDGLMVGKPTPATAVGATFRASEDDITFTWRVVDDDGGASERVVFKGSIYTPTADVVGRRMVVDAQARGGDAKRFTFQSPVRAEELERSDALGRLRVDASTSRSDLRVMTYNVLADAYSHTWSTMFPYFAKELGRAEIRLRQALEDVLVADADVVALQEVDRKWFELLFEPVLTSRGYAATSWCGKSGQTQEGCAMFIKRATFRVEEERCVRLTDIDDDERLRPWLDSDENSELRTALGNITSIAQLVRVTCVANGKRICLGNTHLFYHPGAMHIRVLQAHAFVRKANEFGNGDPLVLCGDFNGEPDDGVIRFLRDGRIRADDDDWIRGQLFRWGGTSSRDRARDLFYISDDGARYETDRDLRVTNASELQNVFERGICVDICKRTLKKQYGASCACGDSSKDGVTNPIVRVKMHVERKCTFKNCHTVAAFVLRRECGLAPGTSLDEDEDAVAEAVIRDIHAAATRGFETVRAAQTALTDAVTDDVRCTEVVPIGCGLTITLPDNSRLVSAGGFLPWTNFVGGFVGALDYIWTSADAFVPRRVSPLPNMTAVLASTALPNAQFPSDHVPVVVDVDFTQSTKS